MESCAFFEILLFKKGTAAYSVQIRAMQGSSLRSCFETAKNIFCFKEENRTLKSPETLDAVGVQPTASSVAIICRVLTEKMQEQSLVSQGFAGF